jgi:putative endonuclease
MIFEKYSVYVIFSTQLNRFYIGETCDFENRLDQHNSGFYNSAYTKKTNDWKEFLLIDCENKSQALKIESHIKKMKSVTFIKNLKKYPEMVQKLKEKYI